MRHWGTESAQRWKLYKNQCDDSNSATDYDKPRIDKIVAGKTKGLFFHIVPQLQNLGLGRFAIYATKDGQVPRQERITPDCLFHACCRFCKEKRTRKSS